VPRKTDKGKADTTLCKLRILVSTLQNDVTTRTELLRRALMKDLLCQSSRGGDSGGRKDRIEAGQGRP